MPKKAGETLVKAQGWVVMSARALEAEKQEHGALKRSAKGWRASLDEASNRIAALTERAARVPGLLTTN